MISGRPIKTGGTIAKYGGTPSKTSRVDVTTTRQTRPVSLIKLVAAGSILDVGCQVLQGLIRISVLRAADVLAVVPESRRLLE